jgi:major membrane immunogen (membrane-anchored lipoprotein)
MKTLFAICLLSCTLVLLSGCGGKNQKAASTTDAKYTVGFSHGDIRSRAMEA